MVLLHGASPGQTVSARGLIKKFGIKYSISPEQKTYTVNPEKS
jgi:hypothetical protein